MFRNWITTVCGLMAASPFVIDGIMKRDWRTIAGGAAIACLGAFAKDSNKTGKSGVMS